jgi:hypothetical protein
MHIIGRADKVDFPEFNLTNIEVKTDTGAFTSSIHCSYVNESESADGEKYLEFKLLDPVYHQFTDAVIKTKTYEKKIVKNSFGMSEERFVIKTKIVIFSYEYPIEFSLSQREEMKYPILLGRKFLNKKFMVNPSVQNVSFKLKSLK